MTDLTLAIRIACDAHASQRDKAGEPYILHPLRVMQRFQDNTARIVAVLHDVIEDSPCDIGFLASQGFHQDILDAVDALTRREDESYEGFIMRLSANDTAVRVKIEDLKDNLDTTRLKSLGARDLERVQKYHRALEFLDGLRS
jgi:(p)ppGpp synthase/HD superfamily hydrolase